MWEGVGHNVLVKRILKMTWSTSRSCSWHDSSRLCFPETLIHQSESEMPPTNVKLGWRDTSVLPIYY